MSMGLRLTGKCRMNSTSKIAEKLLIDDCIAISNAIFCTSEEDRPVFILALIPYLCLVVNEAYEWCKKAKIPLTTFQSKKILESIRASAKLYGNDNSVSFNEQYQKLEEIVRIESDYYKKLAKPCCPGFFISDVGVYLLNKICIGNTIQYRYDFNPFFKLNKSISDSLEEIDRFSIEIGKMLQEIISTLTGTAYKIPICASKTDSFISKDCSFKRKFKRIDSIIVFSLECRINFLLYCFKQKCSQNSMLYLRLIYITFFASKNALQNAGIDCNYIFDNYYNWVFRNSMAHYSLYNKIYDNDINSSAIGYGIIEKYFNIGYSEFVDIIENKLYLILATLEKRYKY